FRRFRDVDTKKHGHQERGGARTELLENQLRRERIRQPVRPVRRRRPPRWVILPRDGSSRQAFQKAFKQHLQLFPGSEADLLVKNFVLLGGDLFQKLSVNGNQHPERGLTVVIHQRDQLVSGAIVLPGPLSLHRQERPKTSALRVAQFGRAQPEFRQVLVWQINPLHGRVFLHVADDVGKLESQSAALGQRLRLRLAIAEYPDAYQSHD